MTPFAIQIIFWLSSILFAVGAFRLIFHVRTGSILCAATIAACLPLLIGLLDTLFGMNAWFGSLDPRENGIYDGHGIATDLRMVAAPLIHGVELTLILLIIESVILLVRKSKV